MFVGNHYNYERGYLRIKSCEDSIEDIQKIIYLDKRLKIPLVYPYKQYAKHKLGVENE